MPVGLNYSVSKKTKKGFFGYKAAHDFETQDEALLRIDNLFDRPRVSHFLVGRNQQADLTVCGNVTQRLRDV